MRASILNGLPNGSACIEPVEIFETVIRGQAALDHLIQLVGAFKNLNLLPPSAGVIAGVAPRKIPALAIQKTHRPRCESCARAKEGSVNLADIRAQDIASISPR